jgi:hypothetical protein
MINYHSGDIFSFLKETKLKSDLVVLPHVTNNCNAWGSGFVLPLAKNIPGVKSSYHKFCADQTDESSLNNTKFGVESTYKKKNAYWLLGEVDYFKSEPEDNTTNKHIVVANMCAQELGGLRPLHYNYLVKCMEDVEDYVADLQLNDCPTEIVTVKFASGLAGGNWDFVSELINDCWIRRGIKVTVCVPQ